MTKRLFYSITVLFLVSVVSLSGCKKDSEVQVPLPVANFSFTGSGENAPAVITFTNSSTNSSTYLWDFGDGTDMSNEKEPQHTYTTGGTFTVQLTATGEGGTNSITKTVNISDPIGPTANFTFIGAGEYAPCLVSFTNTSTDATSYSWDFGDGASSSIESPSHNYLSGGMYTVTLTATNGYGTNMITKNVNIESKPTKVQINKLVIIDYPQANSSGGGWDSFNGPDIFWKLMNSGGTSTYFVSGQLNDANYYDLPFLFTNGLPLEVSNLTKQYLIVFYDHDYPDADDQMDYTYINFSDFSSYPNIIHVVWDDPAYIDFDLYLTWSNSSNNFVNTNNEITIQKNTSKEK